MRQYKNLPNIILFPLLIWFSVSFVQALEDPIGNIPTFFFSEINMLLGILFAILIFIFNVALTYRTLRIIQKYTQNKYDRELDINPYYVLFFNVLYIVHFIDTYTDRIINTHDYFDFKTPYGFGLIVLLILLAMFLDSIKFLIRI